MNDWLAGILFRWALRLASNHHSWWLYQTMRLFWESPEGRALRRQWDDEDGESR